jgi:hypothetical protein
VSDASPLTVDTIGGDLGSLDTTINFKSCDDSRRTKRSSISNNFCDTRFCGCSQKNLGPITVDEGQTVFDVFHRFAGTGQDRESYVLKRLEWNSRSGYWTGKFDCCRQIGVMRTRLLHIVQGQKIYVILYHVESTGHILTTT